MISDLIPAPVSPGMLMVSWGCTFPAVVKSGTPFLTIAGNHKFKSFGTTEGLSWNAEAHPSI
jgi:hypothetical protein